MQLIQFILPFETYKHTIPHLPGLYREIYTIIPGGRMSRTTCKVGVGQLI